MRKLIIIFLFLFVSFISENTMAMPHRFYINAFGGFSIAIKQSGFIRDNLDERLDINRYDFGRTAPIAGVGFGYYLYYVALELSFSQRFSEMGSAQFIQNTGVIEPIRMRTRSSRLFFSMLLFLDSIFGRQWRIHPYLNGGIGVAWNTLGPLMIGSQFGSTIFPGPLAIDGAKRSSFAYKVGLGFSAMLYHGLFGFMQYDYVCAGNASGGFGNNITTVQLLQNLNFKLYTHEFMIGIGYVF